MKKLLFLISLTFLLFPNSQTIWVEDFSPYADGTQNAIKWTTSANNCDADGIPGTVNGNYWGTFNGEFRCEDIEGLTCCSGGQGQSDNIWISEDISILGMSNVYVSISTRVEGNVECSICGAGGDYLEASYQVDGGAWVPFATICGATNGFNDTDCTLIEQGDLLKIRVLLGNQANDETYYFDDILVYSIGNLIIFHN